MIKEWYIMIDKYIMVIDEGIISICVIIFDYVGYKVVDL